MTLSSMTGFARGQGAAGAYVWNWEIKSVNAKGLDVRFRLPPGWDAIEVPVRKAATEALAACRFPDGCPGEIPRHRGGFWRLC